LLILRDSGNLLSVGGEGLSSSRVHAQRANWHFLLLQVGISLNVIAHVSPDTHGARHTSHVVVCCCLLLSKVGLVVSETHSYALGSF